ncbi:hypothetical protein [Pasteuria penetrans]|uniref:hypothetical protein n=1 Tax=Pasteuria penetrans TaxID=86005 RepID=UPI000FBFCC30|nr:hypothetical protein [Pasteuria penetrans]
MHKLGIGPGRVLLRPPRFIVFARDGMAIAAAPCSCRPRFAGPFVWVWNFWNCA